MKIVNAILLSIAIHGLIAAGLIAYLEYAPHPDVLATLDLSSVELSFAETVEESAVVAPQPATVGRTVPSPPQPHQNEIPLKRGCGAQRTARPTNLSPPLVRKGKFHFSNSAAEIPSRS